MKNLIFLSFLFLFQNFYGQIGEKALRKKSLKEIVSIFFETNSDSIIKKKCSDELLNRGKKNNNYNEIAYGYFLLEKMNNGKVALQFNDSVYKYFLKTENDDFILSTLLDKANILNFDLNKKSEALELYLTVYNNPKNNNEFLKIDVIEKIATIKSEYLGQYQESIKLFQKVSNYYKNNLENKKFNSHEKYYWSLFAIASNYKDLNRLDSSSYYNRLGYRLTEVNEYPCYNHLFVLNEAAVEVKRKNYHTSIDSINKIIPQLASCDSNGNLAAAYYYKGKNYQGLNNPDLAAQNYIKMDSIFIDPNILNPKFLNAYKYLIKYYKNKNDLENQLLYIKRFVTIDSILQIENNNYKDVLKEEFEIPQLLAEKEKIIHSLDKKGSSLKLYLILSTVLTLLLTIFLFFQYKKQKHLKIRFEKIIKELNSEMIIDQKKPENNAVNDNKDIGMPIEVFDGIIEKLNSFEKEKEYLESDLTLEKLAAKFDTNIRYLSKVVNINYQKTFPNYLNELRINYIVQKLNTNKQLRNYTISALSEEASFNNSNSFSAAFVKVTGLKPSFFIKELNRIQNSN